MSAKKKAQKAKPEQEAAFVMEGEDRFHSIIVSDAVHFEAPPTAEAIITFVVIRRASGLYDIVNVNKTFMGTECISRNVQMKKGISEKAVRNEVDNLRINLGMGVQKETGFLLKWHTLDLSDIEDMKEQVLRIKAWDRVGVQSPLSDLPPGLSLN